MFTCFFVTGDFQGVEFFWGGILGEDWWQGALHLGGWPGPRRSSGISWISFFAPRSIESWHQLSIPWNPLQDGASKIVQLPYSCGWLPWFMVYGNKLVFMDVNGVYEPTNITAGAPSCRLSSCSLKQRLLKVRRKSMSPIFRHTKKGSHEWKTYL